MKFLCTRLMVALLSASFAFGLAGCSEPNAPHSVSEPKGDAPADAIDEVATSESALFFGIDLLQTVGAAWREFLNECIQKPATPEKVDDGRLWEPMSLGDTRSQRDTFAWALTGALPEKVARTITVEGQAIALPPLYYMQVYVQSANHLRELEEMGVHAELVPLFPSEWPSDDRSLTMLFEGDPEDDGGQFAYTLMTPQVYNLIRAAALAGENTYKAIIPREVPTEMRAPDGSVGWTYLLANVTQFAAPRTEITDQGEVVPPAEYEDGTSATTNQKRIGRRMRKWVRAIADKARVVVDGVRKAIAWTTNQVTKDATLTIVTHVKQRTNLPLVRAWSSTDAPYGDELKLRNVRVNVTGMSHLTQYGGQLNNDGVITVTVPKRLNAHICFVADSSAARIESGVILPAMHCWKRVRPSNLSNHTIEDAVGDSEFFMLAQLIDARDFSNKVMGFKPPKITVQVGPIAQVFAKFNGNVAFVPCLAAPKAPVSLANAYLDGLGMFAPGIDVAVDVLLATDMILPKSARNSRIIPYHEYGHFFFCTLLADERAMTYNNVWSQVVAVPNVLPSASTEVKALNEGFADWFAGQSTGGVDYFYTFGAGLESGGSADAVFDTFDPKEGRGLEENIGGPDCAFPPYASTALPPVRSLSIDATADHPACPVTEPNIASIFMNGSVSQQERVVSRVATLLHDMIDFMPMCGSEFCSSAAFHDGAAWDVRNATATSVGLEVPGDAFATRDESVTLTNERVTAAIRRFANANGVLGTSLSYRNFYGAFTEEMLAAGHDYNEICNLYSLHRSDGSCPADLYAGVASTSVRHTLTGVVSPGDGGTIVGVPSGASTCSGAACTTDRGKTVSLLARANLGFTFDHWECPAPGNNLLNKNGLVYTGMLQDQTCTAVFSALPSFSVQVGVTAGGTVAASSSLGTCGMAGCTVFAGGDLTLNAMPSTGFRFTGWSGCSSSTTALLSFPAVSSNLSCTANFTSIKYTVVASPSAGGTVSPTNVQVAHGGSVTLTAMANAGFRFSEWTGTPGCAGSNSIKLLSNVTTNLVCVANFIATKTVTFSLNLEATTVRFGATNTTSGAPCLNGQCIADVGDSVSIEADEVFALRWRCTNARTSASVVSSSILAASGVRKQRVVLSNLQDNWACRYGF